MLGQQVNIEIPCNTTLHLDISALFLTSFLVLSLYLLLYTTVGEIMAV